MLLSKYFDVSYLSGLEYTAFTLAEVLVTLGIIGIIAAMTLPSVINSYREKQTIVQLKKVYSSLSQAYMYIDNEMGPPDATWDLRRQGDSQGAINLLKPFSKYIKNLVVCELDRGCFPDIKYRSLDGRNRANINRTNSYAKAVINDGTLIYAWVANENCKDNRGDNAHLRNVCGALTVDLNGFKNPNRYGQDLFSFYVTAHGIIPQGSSEDTRVPFDGANSYCSMIRSNEENGAGCAAWVLYNENMDYLHCRTLLWNGKKKCK